MIADPETLDTVLDADMSPSGLPRRLVELALVATEVAEALARPSLDQVGRARILRRAFELASVAPQRSARRLIRPATVGAAGGAAALALAVAGVALLRRHEQHPAAA